MSTFKNHLDRCGSASSAESTRGSGSGSVELTEEKGTTSINWTKNQTLLLISLYKEHQHLVNSGKIKKKTMWEIIRDAMKQKGYTFSADQVAGRWKSIMRAYKNVKDNNKQTGTERKSYEFETQLDELFNRDPAFAPVAVLSSAAPKKKTSGKRALMETSDSDTEGQVLPNLKNTTSQSDDTQKKKQKKMHQRSKSGELVDLFKTYIDDQKEKEKEEKERMEQMHKERIETMNSLIRAISNPAVSSTPSHSTSGTSSRSWTWNPSMPPQE